ncbi:MAG: enoyl-CoA hydratase [Acidimicrobiia bacterium]
MADLVTVTRAQDAAWWRVTFGDGRANVLDRATLEALRDVFVDAGRAPRLSAVILEGRGGHFSYGASVREHLPDQVRPMFDALRGLAVAMLESRVVIVAAARGRCLGAGLEVAALCHHIVVAPTVELGQPEIVLGVFPPLASLLLPARIGRGRAEQLCLTGRVIGATEALWWGLVDHVAPEDPAAAAEAWIGEWLTPRSASSLRYAVAAVRADLAAKLAVELPALETLYLERLMATRDAEEGLRAFLDKRPAVWEHR